MSILLEDELLVLAVLVFAVEVAGVVCGALVPTAFLASKIPVSAFLP